MELVLFRSLYRYLRIRKSLHKVPEWGYLPDCNHGIMPTGTNVQMIDNIYALYKVHRNRSITLGEK